MAGKVFKSKSLHLTNFVPNRKVSASNPATDTYTRTVMGKYKTRTFWFTSMKGKSPVQLVAR